MTEDIDVLILCGSKSDLDVVQKTTEILKKLEIKYDMKIASAHRTPKLLERLIIMSKAKVFIGIAGLSAALPGFIAAHTIKPTIGVPVSGKINLDSILSIVQMPKGIPVAAVGLSNAANAALLAVQILALSDSVYANKIDNYRKKLRS